MPDRISLSTHYRSSSFNAYFADELATLTREERLRLAWRIHELKASRPGEGNRNHPEQEEPLITPIMRHLFAIIVVTFMAIVIFDHMPVGYSLAVGLLAGYLVGSLGRESRRGG